MAKYTEQLWPGMDAGAVVSSVQKYVLFISLSPPVQYTAEPVEMRKF